MLPLVVALAGVALAAATYLGLERLGRRGLVPMGCRAVAWAALGVLLLNTACPADPSREPPLVLLDASLSLGGAQGRWTEAKALADSLGEVRTFGDDAPAAEPTHGRSALAPALVAAAATGRPVTVVTDGEIDDAGDLPRDLLARTGVRLVPRRIGADVAIVRVDGAERLVQGDTLVLQVDLAASGTRDSVTLVVEDGGRALVQRRAAAAGSVRLTLPTTGLPAGERLLQVRLADQRDAEPATDVRLHRLDLMETPGAVLVAAPGDWDARFLYRAVRDVAGVPVRGFVRLEPTRWRDMRDLSPVDEATVRTAARRADLLLLKGAATAFADGSAARGVLVWPSGETGETLLGGDWYLAGAGASPLAGALAGAPLDSFPPATALVPLAAGDDAWIGLQAQEGRRGAPRPAIIGQVNGRVRRVTVAADGLWRWSFRGGSSEQAYRALVGATVAWLLGGADSAQGAARPLRAVVQRGQPLRFEWRAAGAPSPLAITLAGAGRTVLDTLRFGGDGRAQLRLPPGSWRYTLAGGGAGLVAVETYSDEYLPRPVVLREQPAAASAVPRRTSVREQFWLFGLAILALAGEWFARRRLGLR